MPLATVAESLEELRSGRFAIVVDDEQRENEGDLVIAAEHTTPETINFMAREGRGLICMAMTAERLDSLGIPLMVPPGRNTSPYGTAFTISVEARQGITTGISAHDRARTIRVMADPATRPEDFAMPGHVFPLRARDGGVLERPGHTEAAVDLTRLAGMLPAAVICEIMAEDGKMARMPELERFAAEHGLRIVTISDLVAYRRARERAPSRAATVDLPTRHGRFTLIAYPEPDDREPNLALVRGGLSGGEPPLVRLHSECLTGDVFGSARCDCGSQLDRAMELVDAEGRGAVLYLRQEGRGIGLLNKLRAYELQEQGLDTVEANERLGFRADERDYLAAALILRDLGVDRVRLLTNNPGKVAGLEAHGVKVVERVPIELPAGTDNVGYLHTKRAKLGHALGLAQEIHPVVGPTGPA